MGKHSGKVAVVTGGNSGIGLATAQRLAREGAHVFITGRRKAELDEAVRRIESNVTAVQGDVAKQEDLDRLYATIKKDKGSLDIVFANAGTGSVGPLGMVTEAEVDRIFAVNVKGLLFTVQKALPLLKNGASIILNASIAGRSGFSGFSVYNASKAAVRSFARTWSNDLKDRGIRVNAVSPGVVPTPGFKDGLGMSEAQAEAFIQSVLPVIPLGRLGTPDEIAKVVSFLASDEASYITGIDLTVDGGMTEI